MITDLRLPEGTRAFIRGLVPEDREVLRESYEHLSPESQCRRFLTGVPHLTDPMLDHLVDDVDGVDHVALVLVVLDRHGRGTPVGVARMIRYPGHPADADVAVTVVDRWHDRGVATALLSALVRQRPVGVRRIVTTVATPNAASLAMLRRLGATTTRPAGKGRLDVVVQLTPLDPGQRSNNDAREARPDDRRSDEPSPPDEAGPLGREDVLRPGRCVARQ